MQLRIRPRSRRWPRISQSYPSAQSRTVGPVTGQSVLQSGDPGGPGLTPSSSGGSRCSGRPSRAQIGGPRGAVGTGNASCPRVSPVVPVAPVAPVAPVGPLGPVGPVSPGRGRWRPVAPVAPVGPLGPVRTGVGRSCPSPRWRPSRLWFRSSQWRLTRQRQSLLLLRRRRLRPFGAPAAPGRPRRAQGASRALRPSGTGCPGLALLPPAAPVAPARPGAPRAPLSPRGPLTPRGPRGPRGPRAPLGPVGPRGPVGPVATRPTTGAVWPSLRVQRVDATRSSGLPSASAYEPPHRLAATTTNAPIAHRPGRDHGPVPRILTARSFGGWILPAAHPRSKDTVDASGIPNFHAERG